MTDGTVSDGAGLSSEQRAQLERARAALKPIHRSTRYATMTFWTVGGFGVLTSSGAGWPAPAMTVGQRGPG